MRWWWWWCLGGRGEAEQEIVQASVMKILQNYAPAQL
jgi:hypothetical protein